MYNCTYFKYTTINAKKKLKHSKNSKNSKSANLQKLQYALSSHNRFVYVEYEKTRPFLNHQSQYGLTKIQKMTYLKETRVKLNKYLRERQINKIFTHAHINMYICMKVYTHEY